MILHGRNIIVKVDGVAIACARSCELSIDTDTIEVAHPTSGRWKKFIAGRSSWAVTMSGLAAVAGTSQTGTSHNIEKALSLVGQEVMIETQCTQAGRTKDVQFVGPAICTKSQITAILGNLCQGSWTFQGSGELIDTSADVVNCLGILSADTGGNKDGMYLMKNTRNVICRLVRNIPSIGPGESLVQYDVEPNTATIYTVGDVNYRASKLMNNWVFQPERTLTQSDEE